MKISQFFLIGSSIGVIFSTRGSMRNFGLSVSKKLIIYIILLYKKKKILSFCIVLLQLELPRARIFLFQKLFFDRTRTSKICSHSFEAKLQMNTSDLSTNNHFYCNLIILFIIKFSKKKLVELLKISTSLPDSVSRL